MPDFNLNDALTPTVNPFVCPECGSGLQVVRRYVAEDFAEVSAQGAVAEVVDFQIVEQTMLDVLCSRNDGHELALTPEQRSDLISDFIAT